MTFDEISTKLAMNYLLGNYYLTSDYACFPWRLSMPMGADPAPFPTNPDFYCYEKKWLNSTRKNDL